MKEYKGKICKGSWEFKNNCRTCEKCIHTKPELKRYEVTVSVVEDRFVDDKVNILISYPKSQPKMPIQQSCHALVAGINVMIKGCSHNDLGIKDHELLDEVIEHLKSEFIDAKSFDDVMVNDDVVGLSKKENKK